MYLREECRVRMTAWKKIMQISWQRIYIHLLDKSNTKCTVSKNIKLLTAKIICICKWARVDLHGILLIWRSTKGAENKKVHVIDFFGLQYQNSWLFVLLYLGLHKLNLTATFFPYIVKGPLPDACEDSYLYPVTWDEESGLWEA